MSAVLVLVELVDGAPDRLSAEALAFAVSLDSPVDAAVIGPPGVAGAAAGLGSYGVTTAHVVEDGRLTDYSAAAFASGLAAVIDGGSFAAVVAPGSERGTEILAHVAARSGSAMAANVMAAEVGEGSGERWKVTRHRWAGSLLEEAWLDGAPKMLTVAAHAVAAAEPSPGAAAATVVPVTAEIADDDLRARIRTVEAAASDKVSLAEAKVVVGGGRGLGSAEAFAMLDELADLLGAAVGVSRVATSLGWRPHAQQVGQTGTRIAPDLYLACGISGAIQHIVGCKSAKRILAINTDPDAPIFLKATYGIIGDVQQVVPAITAEVRRAKGL
ncbi:electron transfer flavoprotein subunit alpha/FixB family protein [soil metagenome]